MAEYQITYWKDIPTMVTAREGRTRTKTELSPRFMVAVDEAAMRLNLIGSDAYMEAWRRSEWIPRDGTPESLAAAVAAELEEDYSPAQVRTMLDNYGPSKGGDVSGTDANHAGAQSPAPDYSGHPLLQWLESGRLVVFDGAMGTMLQASGLTDGGAPELWNVTAGERVKSIYRGYAQAGSNVITTNTFGGTAARLKLHNLQDRVVELNRAGALLAREVAAETGALVAGDIGPSGELIEPVGPLRMDEAQALFAEQVQGLVEGGVDFILIETMSHLNEAEAAVRASLQVAPNLPIAVTLSFDTNFHTMMGVSPRQAVEAISQWGVKLIGANCGNGPAEIETVMTQMAQHRPDGVYLMAQSNAGMPKWADGAISYDGTPEVMAGYALRLRALGVNVIGACCGSTPEHIAAMSVALQTHADDPIPGPPAPEETLGQGSIESAESRSARAAARRAERHTRDE
jgi:5-methyltetrahydrofolate--homocysteine methyltransferase